MLSDHERRQWDALEEQLTGDSHRSGSAAGRPGRARRQPDDRRRAVLMAAASMMLMAAGHVLAFIPLIFVGGVALYVVARCWFYEDRRRTWSRGRRRASGPG